jgi:protein involved in polysaccharide export with SLBB domain
MKKRHLSPVFTLLPLLLLLLTACTAAVRDPFPFDKLTAQTKNATPAEYIIQPGDQLDIKFFYNPELNEQLMVRPDGRISMQLVKEIMAAGMTPAQLTSLLTVKYGKELQQPELTVIVRSFNSQRVYVDGEVNKPGLVPLVAPTTLLQAVAQAGGMKETARTDEVILIRRGADNRVVTTMLNLEKALDGTDVAQDIPLIPFDILYVPRSHISNVNVWVDQYMRRMIPVSMGMGAEIF